MLLCYDCDQFAVYDSSDASFTEDGGNIRVFASPIDIPGTSERAFNDVFDRHRVPRIHR